jgi:hypothetical protein
LNLFYNVDKVNWPSDYSYCPETSFRIARSNDALFLKFSVIEKNIRALYLKDQDPVWEDSCVEFFCKKANSDTYMNFEFNCIGTCVATTRKGRDRDVIPFSEEQMRKIDRCSSLEREPFERLEGETKWGITVKIPFEILGLTHDSLPDFLLGNFYKCGNETPSPHYVSWNPIPTKSPDFHCPEYFGKLIFKD